MAVNPKFVGSDDQGSVALTTSYQEIVAGHASGSFVMLSASSPGIAQVTISIGNENVDSGTETDNILGRVIIPSAAGYSSVEPLSPPIYLTQSGLIAGCKFDANGNFGIFLNDATKKIKIKSSIFGVIVHYNKLNFNGTAPRFYASQENKRYALTESYANVVVGNANGSFIDSIYLVNTSASDRIIRFADENDRLLGSAIVAGNSGNTINRIPLQVNTFPYMSRLEFDGYGNLGLRLKDATKALKALQMVGTDVFMYYTINHY